jgi:ABC-type dipeptide/oligopeptide/nickel transport system permease component
MAPGDPVQVLFGNISDPVTEARARAKLGLDRPVVEQYLRFLGGLARLDLDVSYAYPGVPIRRMAAEALPATVLLGIVAVAGAIAFGVALGLLAALHPQSIVDRAIRLLTLSGIAVPFFVIAVILVLVFSVRPGWLPVAGWDTSCHLVLPIVVLMLRPLAYITRITRLALLQVLDQEHIRTARSKSLPPVPSV